jgi:hypothetical protein
MDQIANELMAIFCSVLAGILCACVTGENLSRKD